VRLSTRPAGEPDRAFLFEVYASTREDELARTGWDAAQKHAFLEMQFSAQHTQYHEHYPGARFEVVEVDGQPVGRLYVHETPAEIRLMDVALLAPWRNRGIGSRLMDALIAASERSRRPIGLHVERDNPAMRMYLRLGFEEVEERGFYVYMTRPPGTGERA